MDADDDLADASERLRSGTVSSGELVAVALSRIAASGGPDGLCAIIETNPEAAADAARLDAERSAGRVRGPLHGVPVLIKDNVDTAAPLHTTAGSMALQHGSPERDAQVVANLREAGLVVLGKTNLSEWANYRSTGSISGWSAIGGLTRNPHDRDRSAGGSSSGSGAALAAGLAPLALGTETDGSIICPAAFCGVVGLKPTAGLVPTSGVVPISHSQDSVGPMTRTVRDAALLLAAMTGDADAAGLDPGGSSVDDLALSGVRLGLPRVGVWTNDQRVSDAAEAAVRVLAALGATIVDPVRILSIDDFDQTDETCVLDHEFKVDVAAYLATRGPDVPQTLAELIEFNRAHAEVELARFGQEIFERAVATGGLTAPEYVAARRRCLDVSRRFGLDAVMAAYDLDALVLPSADQAWRFADEGSESEHESYVGGRAVGPTALPAMAGYPVLTVPCGLVDGLPVGVSFVGVAHRERLLLRLGHAYEMAAYGPAGSAAAFPPQ